MGCFFVVMAIMFAVVMFAVVMFAVVMFAVVMFAVVMVFFTAIVRMAWSKVGCLTQGSVRWDVIDRRNGHIAGCWISRAATAGSIATA